MASNPLLKFRNEILSKVIYPKLYGIIYANKGNISQSELWKVFREEHDCSVSLREFKEWMIELGLEESKVTTWNCPENSNPVQIETANASRVPSISPPTLMAMEESNYKTMREEIPVPTDPDIGFDNE